ncbi:MAG: hypothetical protein M5U34_24945 [Chloroflexi bacterium]|nr:hypothetical protein [Chloroflexota bacterium]
MTTTTSGDAPLGRCRHPGVTWQTPFKATGQDDFGVIFEVPLAENPSAVNYIFHRGDEKIRLPINR